MSENYESKRLRMQKALEGLPENLRTRVSLRNAESVAALSPQAQTTLADALDKGLIKVARAIELLGQDPQANLDDLLPRLTSNHTPVILAGVPDESTTCPTDTDNIALADLIRACYPDMPQVAAEALANAPAMQEVRAVLAAHRTLTESPHFHTDFVIVTFCGFLRQAQTRLDAIIAQTPSIRQALRQGNVGWPD